jgi:hypothetical protein
LKSPRRSRAGDLDGRGGDGLAAVHAVQHRDVFDSVGGVTERPWSLRMLLIGTKRVDRSGVILSDALSRRYLRYRAFSHLVFADSRRFAEEWTYRFLATALTDAADPSPNG